MWLGRAEWCGSVGVSRIITTNKLNDNTCKVNMLEGSFFTRAFEDLLLIFEK